MYKYVKEFTEPLDDFSYEGLDVTAKIKKEENKLKSKIPLKKKPFYEDEYVKYDTVFCKLCGVYIPNNVLEIERHVNGKRHQKNLRNFKIKYYKYLKQIRKKVLNGKKPRSKHYRRLIYYKLAINYEPHSN